MTHLSRLELDAMRTGDLPETCRAGLVAHLETCATCQARKSEIDEQAAKFIADLPPAILASATLAKAEEKQANRKWWHGLLTPAPAMVAAVVALVVVPLALLPRDTTESPNRRKGDRPPLELFVMDGDTPKPVRGEAVPPESRLRLRFDPGDARFVRILWEDEKRRAGAMFPAAKRSAIEVAGPDWAPREINLDDAFEDERIWGVFCVDDFDHAAALDALENGRSGCKVTTLEVKKSR